mgnify:CR=1 FL=1
MLCLLYLNTSHVKVQLLPDNSVWIFLDYLNTSHVKVQHVERKGRDPFDLFKYISC